MGLEEFLQNNYISMIDSIISKHGTCGNFVDEWNIPIPDKKDFKGRYYFERVKVHSTGY